MYYCTMFVKALCANIGRNFPCVRSDVTYSFWEKNNGEYNFPMNCVWENNMKLNSLVAAHIINIFWLRWPCCGAATHMLIWAAVSYFIHLASAMAGVVHIYWDPGCKLLVLISIFNVLYGTYSHFPMRSKKYKWSFSIFYHNLINQSFYLDVLSNF